MTKQNETQKWMKALKLTPVGIFFGLGFLVAGLCCIWITETDSNPVQANETTPMYHQTELKKDDYQMCESSEYDDPCYKVIAEGGVECDCEGIPWDVPKDIEGDVFMAYELENFNKTYYESRDDDQLRGILNANVSEKCKPFDYIDDRPIAPCGALANAIFVDRVKVKDSNSTVVPSVSYGLLREDLKKGYQNPQDITLEKALQSFTKPPNWTERFWEKWKYDTTNPENSGFQKEAFIIWMRPDLSRRPWWRLNRTGIYKRGLPAGQYKIFMTYRNLPNYEGPRTVTVYSENVYYNYSDTETKPYYALGVAGTIIGLFLFLISGGLLLFGIRQEKQNHRVTDTKDRVSQLPSTSSLPPNEIPEANENRAVDNGFTEVTLLKKPELHEEPAMENANEPLSAENDEYL